MGLTLTWFKEYSVKDKGLIKVSYHDAGEYSFCHANANAVLCTFGQIKCIPKMETLFVKEEGFTVNEVKKEFESKLIPPNDMIKICETLLSDIPRFIKPYFNKESMDTVEDLVDDVRMIKEKSEQGYYVVFESE